MKEAVNAAPDFRRIGVHKGARAAQFAPERCHSPSHTALSKLLYMPLSDCPSKASAEPRWPWAAAKFGLMSGGPLVFHNGVVRVSLQESHPA